MAGILLAVALPKLIPAFRQSTVATTADRVALAHSLARATAVRYGRVARLNLDPSLGRFWVDVDTSGTGLRQNIGAMQYLTTTGLTMTASRTLLCFDARGFATTRGGCAGADATVTIALGGRSTTLTITSLGKVLR
ncbi:MAG TPA: GspH/FimT family pseudopilin [Gemmatimonadales bacterium]|nr:GspH/FimT family pseudopilin [Gemmatimonadales bacterium]